MNILKKILQYLFLIFLVLGLVLIGYAYFTNQTFISYISNLIKESNATKGVVTALIGLAMVFISLLFLSFSFKVSAKIRVSEKEKRKLEKEERKRLEEELKEKEKEISRQKEELEKVSVNSQEEAVENYEELNQ